MFTHPNDIALTKAIDAASAASDQAEALYRAAAEMATRQQRPSAVVDMLTRASGMCADATQDGYYGALAECGFEPDQVEQMLAPQ